MLHRNLPIIFAVGGSLIVHSLFFASAPEYHVSPLVIETHGNSARRENRVTLVFVDPKELPPDEQQPSKTKPPPKPDKTNAPPDAAPPPVPPKPAPPPPPRKPEVEQFPDNMGEFTGKGIGANAAEGLEPLKAREGDQDQGFLSRDPRGQGFVGDPPSQMTAVPGDGGTGGVPGHPGMMVVQAPMVTPPELSAAPAPADLDPIAPRVEPLPTVVPLPGPPPLPAAPAAPAPAVTTAPPRPAPPVRENNDPNSTFLAKNASPVEVPREEKPKTDPQRSAAAKPIQVAMAAPPVMPTDIGAIGVARRPAPVQSVPAEPPAASPVIPPAPPALPAAPVTPVVIVTAPVFAPPPPPRPTPTPAPAPAPKPAAPPLASASPAVAGTGDGHAPGMRHPSADPAQQSDSESDPFTKIGSLNLRDGKLDPQFGRKVKTVRPKIPIVGQVDAFAMAGSAVTLKVNIDATGKVTEVAIAKSSGSNELDQPCLIAMYDWWFEPLKDKHGKPVPDTVMFTISFK